MKTLAEIKSSVDLDRLTSEELSEVYADCYFDSLDEWFPIMYVTEECPHCGGVAHPFENFKRDHLQVRCFNKSCEYSGKVVEQFHKDDDFLRTAIESRLSKSL